MFLNMFFKVVSNYFLKTNALFIKKNNATLKVYKKIKISLNIQYGGAVVGHVKSFKKKKLCYILTNFTVFKLFVVKYILY